MAQIQSTHWEKQMNITLMLSASHYYSSCDTYSCKLDEEHKSTFACKFSIKSAASDSSSSLNLNCHSDLNWRVKGCSCMCTLSYKKCIFRPINNKGLQELLTYFFVMLASSAIQQHLWTKANKCCLVVLQAENSRLVCMSGVCVMDQRSSASSATTGGWFLSGLNHQLCKVRGDLQTPTPDREIQIEHVCKLSPADAVSLLCWLLEVNFLPSSEERLMCEIMPSEWAKNWVQLWLLLTRQERVTAV